MEWSWFVDFCWKRLVLPGVWSHTYIYIYTYIYYLLHHTIGPKMHNLRCKQKLYAKKWDQLLFPQVIYQQQPIFKDYHFFRSAFVAIPWFCDKPQQFLEFNVFLDSWQMGELIPLLKLYSERISPLDYGDGQNGKLPALIIQSYWRVNDCWKTYGRCEHMLKE